MTFRYFSVGDRVRNTTDRYCVPVGTLGRVVPGPACTYGATVLWDGYEMHAAYGHEGWRPYWGTDQMEHVDMPVLPDQCDWEGNHLPEGECDCGMDTGD